MTKRLRRALKIAASVACDMLLEGNRAGAIAALATAIPLEYAIAWTMPSYPASTTPCSGRSTITAIDPGMPLASASRLERLRGYDQQLNRAELAALGDSRGEFCAVELGTELHLALERAAKVSGASIAEVTATALAFTASPIGRDIAAWRELVTAIADKTEADMNESLRKVMRNRQLRFSYDLVIFSSCHRVQSDVVCSHDEDETPARE